MVSHGICETPTSITDNGIPFSQLCVDESNTSDLNCNAAVDEPTGFYIIMLDSKDVKKGLVHIVILLMQCHILLITTKQNVSIKDVWMSLGLTIKHITMKMDLVNFFDVKIKQH